MFSCSVLCPFVVCMVATLKRFLEFVVLSWLKTGLYTSELTVFVGVFVRAFVAVMVRHFKKAVLCMFDACFKLLPWERDRQSSFQLLFSRPDVK